MLDRRARKSTTSYGTKVQKQQIVYCHKLLDLLGTYWLGLLGLSNLITRLVTRLVRLVHNESSSLDLLLPVETKDTDVGSREGSLALLNLPQHLVGIIAAEQRQLPHGPVPAIIVSGAGVVLAVDETVCIELNAGAPALLEEVVHLPQDLLSREGGEVGEGLELLVVHRGPHLHGLNARSI